MMCARMRLGILSGHYLSTCSPAPNRADATHTQDPRASAWLQRLMLTYQQLSKASAHALRPDSLARVRWDVSLRTMRSRRAAPCMQAAQGAEVSAADFAAAEPDVLRKSAAELVQLWNR